MERQWEGNISVTLTTTFDFQVSDWNAKDEADARCMVEQSLAEGLVGTFQDGQFQETWVVDGEVI